MGCGVSGRLTAIYLSLLFFISSINSFYLPGVAPRDFQTVKSKLHLIILLCFFVFLVGWLDLLDQNTNIVNRFFSNLRLFHFWVFINFWNFPFLWKINDWIYGFMKWVSVTCLIWCFFQYLWNCLTLRDGCDHFSLFVDKTDSNLVNSGRLVVLCLFLKEWWGL